LARALMSKLTKKARPLEGRAEIAPESSCVSDDPGGGRQPALSVRSLDPVRTQSSIRT
jgi:hypothetical protein